MSGATNVAEGLRVADGISLPIDYVTKTAAILAQRRKGKTYCASVLAEELVAARLPWVALDPTGAWWGLRSSADGEHAGLPVVVIGGQHGDLPLDVHAGAAVADLVLDHPGWYVLDLSLLEGRPAERQFATAFAERLHRRKMQPGMDFPLHLFVDEADLFVPQEKETKGDVPLLAAYQGIVRRGGLHGLGVTLISQRPALVNKNVLTQLDLLVLLRLVAGNDQDAVSKNYVSRFLDRERAAEVMQSLASLPVGEAWFLEPGAEPPLAIRERVRLRRTFNSSATPRAGEKRVEPKVFADVDLDAIRAQMGEAVERALADDPAELRRRLAVEHQRRLEVERELHDLREWAVEVEQADDGPTAIDALIAVYQIAKSRVGYSCDLVDEARALAAGGGAGGVTEEQALAALDRIAESETAIMRGLDLLRSARDPIRHASDLPVEEPHRPAERSAAGIAADARKEAAVRGESPSGDQRTREMGLGSATAASSLAPAAPSLSSPTWDYAIGAGATHLLRTLGAHYPMRPTLGQLALLANRKARGGAWNSAMKQLREGGYIVETDGMVVLTDAGAAKVGADTRPMGAAETRARWREALPPAAREIFDLLLATYPRPRTLAEIATTTGRTPRGGSWNSALATLTRNGLARRVGDALVATEDAAGG